MAPGRSSRTLSVIAQAVTIGFAVCCLQLVVAAPASADPSGSDWYRLRMCESGNRYPLNTGNGQYGAYQFTLQTWRAVGGSGYPNQAAPAEQDRRALILWQRSGWWPWNSCARRLGLH